MGRDGRAGKKKHKGAGNLPRSDARKAPADVGREPPPPSGPPQGRLANFFRALIARRWLVLAFWAVVLGPAAYYATKVGQDSSVDRIIASDDPGMVASRAFGEVFGSGDYAVLIVEADDPLAPAVLEKVDAIERGLAGIPVIRPTSIVSTFRATRGGFKPDKDAAMLKGFVTGTKLFRAQGLFGDDFLIIGMVLDVHGRDERDTTLAAVDKVLEEVGTGAPLRVVRRVGKPYVDNYFDSAQKRSGPLYFGLFMAFVVVLILALYRSFRTIVAFLVTLGVGLAVSLGYIGAVGGTFTLVSPMVPMTILVTATATLVYLHSRFVERPEGSTVDDHQIFALTNKFVACTASIFAATVGFAALVVSAIKPIRDMGSWVAVGLFVTWLTSFTLFPALQRILRTPTHLERQGAAPWFRALARWLPGFTYRFRWPLVLGAVALAAGGAVALFGAGSLVSAMKPVTEPIEYVSRDTAVYRDTERARAILPGMSVTNVWLKGPKDTLLSDGPMLAGLNAFEERLRQDPDVGAVVGLPSILRLMRYAQTHDDAWPKDAEEVEELAGALEEMSMHAPDALRAFVDRSLTQTQLTVLSGAIEHEAFERLESHIKEHWAEAGKAFPALQKLELATVGLGPLQAKMSRSLVPTLVESFGLTAGIIFVTFLLVFRSGAARIMTMVPSLFAILVMFLVMRLVGMGPNIATILIASTVLGTSENDQIHFFYHFLEGRKKGTVSQALEHTLLVSGRAIFFATIINAGGFLAFAFGEMRPMQQFGALTALALTLSMLADFTALPAALWLVFRAKPDAPEAKGAALPVGAGAASPPVAADATEKTQKNGEHDGDAAGEGARASDEGEGAHEADAAPAPGDERPRD